MLISSEDELEGMKRASAVVVAALEPDARAVSSVEREVRRWGFALIRELAGHGVGRSLPKLRTLYKALQVMGRPGCPRLPLLARRATRQSRTG